MLIALGSNIGDRLSHLQAAVDVLGTCLSIHAAARIYETEAMYVENQGPFYNSALLSETERSPRALLALLKAAEAQVGRHVGPRYGPREIDIDLISYGSTSYRFSEGQDVVLEIPHSRVAERRFVLQPLFDLLPAGSLPGLGSIEALLTRTNDQANCVHRVENAVLSIHRD